MRITVLDSEIMDILFQQPNLSVREVNVKLDRDMTYSATRAAMYRLVQKGTVTPQYDGPRHRFSPTNDRSQIGTQQLKRIQDVYYEGSEALMIAAILEGAEQLPAETI